MSRKSKGINAERSLIHQFWKQGWAAIRVAGSGAISYPCPDILAGNNIRKLAIECKASKDTTKYLTKDEVNALVEFGRIFGAEPWIALKFNKIPWYFIAIEDMTATEKSYVVTIKMLKNKGLLIEEVIK